MNSKGKRMGISDKMMAVAMTATPDRVIDARTVTSAVGLATGGLFFGLEYQNLEQWLQLTALAVGILGGVIYGLYMLLGCYGRWKKIKMGQFDE